MGVIKELTKQQFEEMRENRLKPPKCHCGGNPDIIITLAEYGKRKIVIACRHCLSKVEVAIPTEIFSNDGRLLTIETEKGLAKAITKALNAWVKYMEVKKMNCMEREGFQNSKLFHIIDDITHMENEGHRYKAMYILWDIIQRIKKGELTASMNQAEVFADYGIIIKDGKITDWGNTNVDTWKNKLIMSGGLKIE